MLLYNTEVHALHSTHGLPQLIVIHSQSVVQDDHVAQLMLYDDCIWDTGQPLYDPDEEHCAGYCLDVGSH
jgi:hypothetical protein